ncbi:MAG TPA: hypothetical protein VF533_25520 [Solirubrobacteraceae bacterium]|jgi:hypothetical protein
MNTRVRAVAGLVAILAGGSAVALAAEPPPPDTLTPEGPATIRENWLGGVTLEELPPQVLVGWKVTVGPGGRGGPVRLRVLLAGNKGTVVGSGPVEQLPAEPGTYAFGLFPGIPYDHRDAGLALDQEAGGHAVVWTHPAEPDLDPPQPDAVDVFRPPLPDGARDVRYTERRKGQELAISGIIEVDRDEDHLGDETQDLGDLKLLRAWVAGRRNGALTVRARVRNVGTTVRDQPQIRWPRSAYGRICVGAGPKDFYLPCPAPRLRPGAEGVLRLRLEGPPTRAGRNPWRKGFPPRRIEVASEGRDTNPADNTGPLAPLLELRRARGGVAVRSSHPGVVRVLRRGRVVRSVRLRRPGWRVVRLARRDHLAAAQDGAKAELGR